MQETFDLVQSLSQEDFLEKRMATHSSILGWRIPWTEESLGCSPWGYKEVNTTEWLTLFMFHFHSKNYDSSSWNLQNSYCTPFEWVVSFIAYFPWYWWVLTKRNRIEINKKAMLWLFRRTEIEIWQKLPPFFSSLSLRFLPFSFLSLEIFGATNAHIVFHSIVLSGLEQS